MIKLVSMNYVYISFSFETAAVMIAQNVATGKTYSDSMIAVR